MGRGKLLEKSSLRVCCCSIAAHYNFTLALSQTDYFMGDVLLDSTVWNVVPRLRISKTISHVA
jgi:hypothetical protein